MEEKETKSKIEKWMTNLKSGNGDYKRVYVEDYVRLLILLGVATKPDEWLLKELTELSKKLS